MPPTDAQPIRPSEARARERVDDLLSWALAELGLDGACARACAEDLVRSARRAQGVASLPAAHEQLLLRAGGGGPGSALGAIFGADLVGVAAMLGGLGAPPMREVGLELVEALGYGLDEFDVVIRVRPGSEVEYVVTGSPDPPVWAFTSEGEDPVLRHPSFTGWLEYRIRRACKRRYPLRRVVVPALSTPASS